MGAEMTDYAEAKARFDREYAAKDTAVADLGAVIATLGIDNCATLQTAIHAYGLAMARCGLAKVAVAAAKEDAVAELRVFTFHQHLREIAAQYREATKD